MKYRAVWLLVLFLLALPIAFAQMPPYDGINGNGSTGRETFDSNTTMSVNWTTANVTNFTNYFNGKNSALKIVDGQTYGKGLTYVHSLGVTSNGRSHSESFILNVTTIHANCIVAEWMRENISIPQRVGGIWYTGGRLAFRENAATGNDIALPGFTVGTVAKIGVIWSRYSATNLTVNITVNGTQVGLISMAAVTNEGSFFKFGDDIQGVETSCGADIYAWSSTNTSTPDNFTISISPATVGNNVTFNARDIFGDFSLTNFSVTMYNGNLSNYSTGNGTLPINDGKQGMFNITFQSNQSGGYHNKTYFNINVSGQTITGNLTKLYGVYSRVFNGTREALGLNYTRTLGYTINYTCPSWNPATLNVLINNVNNITPSINCTNTTNIYYSSILRGQEGNFNISFNLLTNEPPPINNISFSGGNFTADLNSPAINFLNFTAVNGVGQPVTNITFQCEDTVMKNLTYNITFQGNQIFYNNVTNGSTKIQNATLSRGINIAIGTCYDLFSSSTRSVNNTVYFNTIYLIDEKDNVLFNLADANSTKLFFDDNHTVYDFKANNMNAINFTTLTSAKLRVEIGYDNGNIVNRYLDVSLAPSDELRVCANKEGIPTYEQIAISNEQQPVWVLSVYPNCYVAMDYTRFGYQDAQSLKYITIDAPYYLYILNDDGIQVLLSSLDGSISTTVNIDTLEFLTQTVNLQILADGLGISKITNTSFLVEYINFAQDNTALNLEIYKMDTGAILLNTNSFINPNNFSLMFDYTSLTDVDDYTVFRLTLTKTTAAGTATIVRYFNQQVRTGVIQNGMAITISILLTIFSVSLVASKYVFGWFGMFMEIIAIIILQMAVGNWVTTFLTTMEAIILLYMGVILWSQNYTTVT